jgi:hypothetical protein
MGDNDSGIIYGDTDTDPDNGAATDNTATGGNGHAAWVVSGPKKRDATAGTGDNDSGIIHGDTDTDPLTGDATENTATGGNGHAAWVNTGSKKRNTTAGTGDNLNSAAAGTDGGWEE